MEGGHLGEVMDNAVGHVGQERSSNKEHALIHGQATEEPIALENCPSLQTAR